MHEKNIFTPSTKTQVTFLVTFMYKRKKQVKFENPKEIIVASSNGPISSLCFICDRTYYSRNLLQQKVCMYICCYLCRIIMSKSYVFVRMYHANVYRPYNTYNVYTILTIVLTNLA